MTFSGLLQRSTIVGGLALYIELHAPGLGIGGFISFVCFALFFWSHFLEGTAGWLEVTLFVTGCICLLTEIFVLPGFVIFGLGGGVLILTSIVLASLGQDVGLLGAACVWRYRLGEWQA